MGDRKADEKLHFIYKGVEYDATGYVKKHPGGPEFLITMRKQRKDITEYFKAYHSEEAESMLKSLPEISKGVLSKESKKYLKIYQKVKHLYHPNWYKQAAILTIIIAMFLTALIAKYSILSMACYAICQILGAWMSHSMVHSRNNGIIKISRVSIPILTGMTVSWWANKHGMHHMFTNSTRLDDDLNHTYSIRHYPFLFVKWRFDAMFYSLRKFNLLEIFLLFIHYTLVSRQRVIYLFVGALLAGFYCSHILLGNHQRQKRYNNDVKDDYLDHQLSTTRNYPYQGIIALILLGGMQYETQHHLFPQIPFYNLGLAKNIINEELLQMNKQIKLGQIL